MGVCGQRYALAALPRGRDLIPIVEEAGCTSGWVWTGADFSPPPGFDPRTAQPVACRRTD